MIGRPRRVVLLVLLLVGWLAVPRETAAFTIASGFTDSCHEKMSHKALGLYLAGLSERHEVPLPSSALWKQVSGDIRAFFEHQPELAALLAEDPNLFAAYSLFVGLREPDTDGYSVTDLNAIRSVHGDPAPRAQYAHALRSTEDTGPAGDLNALIGTRELVEEHLTEMQKYLGSPGPSQITATHLYVEHYGRTEVPVWGPAFRLGLALHALQDSFSHTIRSAEGSHILHVLNYVDAFRGDLNPDDDGLAHSTGMDRCDDPEVAFLVEAAEERSMAMVVAALKWAEGDGGQAVQAGLSDCPTPVGESAQRTGPECGWFAYLPQCQERVAAGADLAGTCCDREGEFCDAETLPLIEATPTRPYLKETFGCSASVGRFSSRGLLGLGFLLSLWVLRRRSAPVVLGGLALFVEPIPCRAQELEPASPVLRLEGHASLLTDAANESLLNVSYGPALRGGYRWRGAGYGQWGVFGLVERDLWLVHEFESRVDPGVVNLALGVEFLYYGFLRTAFAGGASALVFDTGLHRAGNVGVFTELHPLGMIISLRRWGDFWTHWSLTFDPLAVAWVNPTLEWEKSPSVGHLQYRTAIGIEWRGVGRRAH